MKVISPFGPKIGKLKFSSKLIKIINLEVDKIVSKKKLYTKKKLDLSTFMRNMNINQHNRS